MGLSTKQVSSDGLDWGESFNFQSSGLVELSRWRQSHIYQPDPLPCPRCCSKNTKFCYYNNYNKSQPRHFCKACKRHWTKGGILRNVPVGGGQKKKRLKTSATSVTSIAMESRIHQQSQNLSLALGDQNDTFRILSQGSFSNMGNNVNSHFSDNHISSFPLSHNPVPPFTFSSLGPFEIEGNSTPLNGDHNLVWPASLEDEITIMPSISCFTSPTWHAPTTGTGIDVPSCWNWYDVDPLVAADQLNIYWDDTHEIKP